MFRDRRNTLNCGTCETIQLADDQALARERGECVNALIWGLLQNAKGWIKLPMMARISDTPKGSLLPN